MNKDVLQSRQLVSRRRALGLGGTIGLGGLLAACSVDSTTAQPGSAASATASATAGSKATATGTLPSSTTAASDVIAMLDKAGTCAMSSEETAGPYWFDVDSIRTDHTRKPTRDAAPPGAARARHVVLLVRRHRDSGPQQRGRDLAL